MTGSTTRSLTITPQEATVFMAGAPGAPDGGWECCV
ncbi:hypothetical protein IW256_002948 [Actinomadura viridis]|uniref:Uncharacterized protein n=1 Tax=Actinomadura viridis TaxID=58110 RepID=A0A931GJ19_9ACTN|nr:hypothetical protein [Actinomadura viridis]